MQLYDTLFLFVFLPIFMGIYAWLSPKRRPALISLANLLFIALNGYLGLIVFFVSFFVTYFSGVFIYNYRLDERKRTRQKLLVLINILIGIIVLLFFSSPQRITLSFLRPFSMLGAMVMPLHTISYLVDVYRGDKPAQTRVTVLMAYLGFFPSITCGLVLKYKSFSESFDAPNVTREKLSSGIRLYTVSLASYVVIGVRLNDICDEIIATSVSSLSGGVMWLCALAFYVCFCVNVVTYLGMAHGISLMLGFAMKPCVKRIFRTDNLRDRIRGLNRPLFSWFKDYIYKPICNKDKRLSFAAVIVAICLMALWYRCAADSLCVGILAALFILFQSVTKSHFPRISRTVKCVVTKLMIIALVMMYIFLAFIRSGSLELSSLASTSGDDFLSYLLSTSALALLLGLIIIDPIVPMLLKKLNRRWLQIVMPAAEFLLIMISAAFMINA